MKRCRSTVGFFVAFFGGLAAINAQNSVPSAEFVQFISSVHRSSSVFKNVAGAGEHAASGETFLLTGDWWDIEANKVMRVYYTNRLTKDHEQATDLSYWDRGRDPQPRIVFRHRGERLDRSLFNSGSLAQLQKIKLTQSSIGRGDVKPGVTFVAKTTNGNLYTAEVVRMYPYGAISPYRWLHIRWKSYGFAPPPMDITGDWVHDLLEGKLTVNKSLPGGGTRRYDIGVKFDPRVRLQVKTKYPKSGLLLGRGQKLLVEIEGFVPAEYGPVYISANPVFRGERVTGKKVFSPNKRGGYGPGNFNCQQWVQYPGKSAIDEFVIGVSPVGGDDVLSIIRHSVKAEWQ